MLFVYRYPHACTLRIVCLLLCCRQMMQGGMYPGALMPTATIPAAPAGVAGGWTYPYAMAGAVPYYRTRLFHL